MVSSEPDTSNQRFRGPRRAPTSRAGGGRGLGDLRFLRTLRNLRNLRGPHQRPLQRLIKLQRNDVVDPLALQVPQKRILTEPGVRAQQPDRLARQMLTCGVQKADHVVGAAAVARSQSNVGDHAHVRHKGHQRMVRASSGFSWVVAACGPRLLLTEAGDHR